MRPSQLLAVALFGAIHGYALAADGNWLAAAILGVVFPAAAVVAAKDFQSRDVARLTAIVLIGQLGLTLLIR